MHLVAQSTDDMHAIASRLATRLLSVLPGRTTALVVALRGELGSGKTTFTQGLARALGVAEHPKSPTFNLMKEYAIPGTPYHLWHLDCYRLAGRGDLAALDLHARFADPHNIMVIEWPERIGDGLPKDHIEIRFNHGGNDKRFITIPDA
jgi:tRNA threonylcarbamoyladenosine biosynthesis protein TsaE